MIQNENNALSLDELEDVIGGAGSGSYVNVRLDKLKAMFEKACKKKKTSEIIALAGELQARGCYGWAKETANSYGIYSI